MMCNRKTKLWMMCFLLVEIQIGDGMPQGFFSQGFSIPRFVTNLQYVKIESPIKSSLFNVFGKQNIGNTIDKSEQQPFNTRTIGQGNDNFKTGQNHITNNDNGSGITNQEKQPGQNTKDRNDIKLDQSYKNIRDGEELVSNFDTIDETVTNNEIGGDEVTTESIIETTTDEFETTVSMNNQTKHI